jgi:hypothetical protein
VLRNYNHLVEENGGPPDEWQDVIWSVYAFYDAEQAIGWFGDWSYEPEIGETKAHTYHWVHNLDAMGQIDTVVTADVPTYTVFEKDGERTYVGYNPDDLPSTVSYSDGRTLDLAPGELRGCAPDPGDFDCDETVGLNDHSVLHGCLTGPDALTALDYDGDGMVDLDDFGEWQVCLAGPGVTSGGGCNDRDLNRDGHVDLADFVAFEVLFTGLGGCEVTDLDHDYDVDVGDFAEFQRAFTE